MSLWLPSRQLWTPGRPRRRRRFTDYFQKFATAGQRLVNAAGKRIIHSSGKFAISNASDACFGDCEGSNVVEIIEVELSGVTACSCCDASPHSILGLGDVNGVYCLDYVGKGSVPMPFECAWLGSFHASTNFGKRYLAAGPPNCSDEGDVDVTYTGFQIAVGVETVTSSCAGGVGYDWHILVGSPDCNFGTPGRAYIFKASICKAGPFGNPAVPATPFTNTVTCCDEPIPNTDVIHSGGTADVTNGCAVEGEGF